MSDTAQSQLPLPIDRRPVRMVNCFNGDPNDSLGRAPWWADANDAEAVLNLRRQLDRAYGAGYSRFMLNLPAGHPTGQHLMPSSQWLTMPRQRRRRLMAMLPNWKQSTRERSVEIYVYAGFALSDPYSLDMTELGVTPDIAPNWAWFQANWREWIEGCLIDGIGFDTASKPEHRAAFVKIARVLSIAGVKCIGEAIPLTSTESYEETPGGDLTGGTTVPAREVTQAPWFALDQFIATRDLRDTWSFNPATTEVGVGLRESMRMRDGSRVPVTEAHVRGFFSRGLIPYVYSSKWDILVMELTANIDADAVDE